MTGSEESPPYNFWGAQEACLLVSAASRNADSSASYRRLQAGSVRYPDEERGDLETARSQLIVIARDESQVTS